ncbi:MAG: DNA repair protein RecN [Clostridiales Family XIII bacterium]|jgi:DNA repair protein RecN (Recombination protein N)|nr:DNA repair protein RecN [Clostridiales Family XIII bacterium]
MLKTVLIKNFAIIKNLEIDFNPGLNILTGETGSGKSIIFEAISLVLGERADKEMIRENCESAFIEIDINKNKYSREIFANGRTVSRINNEKKTLNELSNTLHSSIDIHGQYDNQDLLNEENHIKILDEFARSDLKFLKKEVSDKYDEYIKLNEKLSNLKFSDMDSIKEKKILEFELDEINTISPKINEDKILEDEIYFMKNSEKILNLSKSLLNLLDNEEGAISSVSKIIFELNNLSELLPGFKNYNEDLGNFSNVFNELKNELLDKVLNLNFNEKDFDEKILRLDKLENLKKSYNKNIEEILEYKNIISDKLFSFEDIDELINKYESEIKIIEKSLLESSLKLSEKRKENAILLEEKINKNLKELYFPNAKFKIDFILEQENFSKNGMDEIKFLFSANRGVPIRALSKVASGGEVSRLMLAIKSIQNYDSKKTLIFDEIDTGISGKAADIVGKRLKELSEKTQIILTTHLPQIASYADSHFLIRKEELNEQTLSKIQKLNKEQSKVEIARLISGKNITENSLKVAEDLLK